MRKHDSGQLVEVRAHNFGATLDRSTVHWSLPSLPRSFVIITIALLLKGPSVAAAFQEGGHYYTTYIVLSSLTGLPFTPEEIRLVAICAELPDKTGGLDATESYTRLLRLSTAEAYLKWSLWDDMTDPDVLRMITIEQLLHGLTGGNADVVRKIASNLVQHFAQAARTATDPVQRATDLCALGLAIHLLGDSFAHRQIGDPSRMYPTGRGHAGDFTFPDLPMYSGVRESFWIQYANALATAVTGASSSSVGARLDTEVRQHKPRGLILGGANTCLGNDCNEISLRNDVLYQDLLQGGSVDMPTFRRLENVDLDRAHTCDTVLRSLLGRQQTLARCDNAWKEFRTTATTAFLTPDARDKMFKGLTVYYARDDVTAGDR